ncbi:MAG TPA: hypothetical protein VGO63_01655 [Candidatus Paceibacterota bacterium]|jgi:hypothetical protein|nr:hypothetical protein [Candidatus Paceibacterota bacterium]
MKFKGEKFLPEAEIKKEALGWKASVNQSESKETGYEYIHNRHRVTIDLEHNLAFITKIIPDLIAKKQNGEKVRILDVGGGLSLFAEKIRQSFPDKVIVYSTGLSKQAVKNERKQLRNENYHKVSEKLNPRDLKWRSIKQLSNCEEFDLIIDTYGEYYYDVYEKHRNSTSQEKAKAFENYLTIISSKLKPNGIASIKGGYHGYEEEISDDTLAELENKLSIKISIKRGLEPNIVVKKTPKI